MVSETGTYFKGIYDDIVKRLPSFPNHDPSPNFQECIKTDYVNFVRAERLPRLIIYQKRLSLIYKN